MGERDGETCASEGGGGTALPRPKTAKRPTIIRPAVKVSPGEPPPRPVSRPNTVISPVSSQKTERGLPGKKKLEITVIDAKPMSELGFRDMKGSTGNVPTSLPVCNSESAGGTSVQSTQLRSHPEGDQGPSHGVERVHDNEDESRILQKPSTPPKSMKPTIIRPGSRAQPVTGEDKLLPTPPPRPSATPKSDPSLWKSTSVQGIPNLPQQPLQAQDSLMDSPNTPSTNNRTPSTNNQPPVQSSVSHQAPQRPPRHPASGLPAHKTAANHQDASVQQLGRNSEIHLSPKETPVESQGLSSSSLAHTKNKSHDKESSGTESALLKPKPLPKPRPVSVRSPGFKADVTSENDVNKEVNEQSFPPDMSSQSHGMQEDIWSQKSKWSPVTNDERIGEGEQPVPLRKRSQMAESTPKPQTVNKIEVSEKAAKRESIDNMKPVPAVGQKNNSQEQPLPVHKLPPALPPAPHTSGSKPSPATIREPDTSASPNPHVDYMPASPKMPPARPATSAPARGKSMAIGEKIPAVADSMPSSTSAKKTDIKKPPQPAASRSLQKSAEAPSLPKRPGPGHPLYHYISRQPHGIALHDYTATQPDELSFSEGDTVILVKEIDEQWMVGRLGDNEGMYPAAFVEVRCPISRKKPSNSIEGIDSWSSSDSKGQKTDNLTGPRCKARFDFDGDDEGELTLEDGDVVEITERVGTEWLRGQHRGRHGIFPSSFVEILEDLPPDNSTDGHTVSNCVSALFDFDGKEGELIFKAGDQITIIGEVNSDWLFGTCHGQKGQFPTSFVSHIPPNLQKYEPDQSAHSKSKHTSQSEQVKNAKKHQEILIPGDEFWESREDVLGFCRAMVDYTDPSLGYLEFRKGDRIEIVEFCGEDWARGRLGRKEGMFPLRLVAEEVNSPPRTPEPEVVKKVFGKVLHDFNGETPDDLVIKEGDIIEVEDFADVNKHWRWGTLDGKRGMFPAEFVEILE